MQLDKLLSRYEDFLYINKILDDNSISRPGFNVGKIFVNLTDQHPFSPPRCTTKLTNFITDTDMSLVLEEINSSAKG